jgi:malate synthase
VDVSAADLLDFRVEGGQITEEGARLNINVALQYLDAWLGGWGAAAIFNLMEDTATAEISRAQLWQWRMKRVKLADGRTFDADLYRTFRDEELAELGGREAGHYAAAAEVLDELVLGDGFPRFLTLVAYPRLEG